MKYEVGQKVKIKSLDWYNRYTNGTEVDCGAYPFTSDMKEFCGQERIIANVCQECYLLLGIDDKFVFTDEMIEGLVEEESKSGTASNPIEIKSNANCLTQKRVDALAIKIDKELPYGNPYEWECPEGYQFIDENGNVINATKIVLEKKKKEYPKTYEECINILGGAAIIDIITYYYGKQLNALYKLLICRDAYWKIAGEEMGLDKSWKPIIAKGYCTYAIIHHIGRVRKSRPCADSALLEFPTEEMRDAFKENFDPDIEICKELL